MLHERVEKAVAAASPTPLRRSGWWPRSAALTGFDDWAPTLLAEAPAELLQAELVASTRRILDLPPR